MTETLRMRTREEVITAAAVTEAGADAPHALDLNLEDNHSEFWARLYPDQARQLAAYINKHFPPDGSGA